MIFILRVLFSIFYRMKVHGRVNVPRTGSILFVANHQSNFDPAAVGVLAKDRPFLGIARDTLFKSKLLAAYIRGFGAISIKRGESDMVAIRKSIAELAAGRCVMMFPEGTRNKSRQFLEPRSGIGMMVARNSVPVLPVYLSGTVNVWRTLAGLERAVVRFGPVLRFDAETDGNRKGAYRRIGNDVMVAIDSLRRASLGEQDGSTPGGAE